MSYDDIEIEDMEWNEELSAFTYPCPCGDLFQITKEELAEGEEIARCPSCSLYITVVYDPMVTAVALPELQLQTPQHEQHRYKYQQPGRYKYQQPGRADFRLCAIFRVTSMG
ncbi:hypothetical protein WJX82_005471 [Trebouxia sp. C0006]